MKKKKMLKLIFNIENMKITFFCNFEFNFQKNEDFRWETLLFFLGVVFFLF